jgi:hypothetical protein
MVRSRHGLGMFREIDKQPSDGHAAIIEVNEPPDGHELAIDIQPGVVDEKCVLIGAHLHESVTHLAPERAMVVQSPHLVLQDLDFILPSLQTSRTLRREFRPDLFDLGHGDAA